MSIKDIKEYLLSLNIPKEDKRYVLNFCKKLEYMDSLRQTASASIDQPIELGYGDINSKICFIFKDKEHMKSVKKDLQTHLDCFGLNIWDVWVTFINKVPIDYKDKYTFLQYELNAINPSVIYIFDNDPSIEQTIKLAKCSNLKHYFFIDTNVFSKEDAKKILWNQFRFLINYQSLDIKE